MKKLFWWSISYYLDDITRTPFHSISHFWVPLHGLPLWSATWLQLFEPHTFLCPLRLFWLSCKICENSSDWTDLSHMPTSEPLWCGEIMCTDWLWFGHWLFLWPSLHFLLLCFGLLSLSFLCHRAFAHAVHSKED